MLRVNHHERWCTSENSFFSFCCVSRRKRAQSISVLRTACDATKMTTNCCGHRTTERWPPKKSWEKICERQVCANSPLYKHIADISFTTETTWPTSTQINAIIYFVFFFTIFFSSARSLGVFHISCVLRSALEKKRKWKTLVAQCTVRSFFVAVQFITFWTEKGDQEKKKKKTHTVNGKDKQWLAGMHRARWYWCGRLSLTQKRIEVATESKMPAKI